MKIFLVAISVVVLLYDLVNAINYHGWKDGAGDENRNRYLRNTVMMGLVILALIVI